MNMSLGLTDSPMEAVAIMNYLCLRQAGVWAWIAAAFLTTTAAAISFFSRFNIKSSSDSLHFHHSCSSSLQQSDISATSVDPLDGDKDKEEKHSSSSSTTSRRCKTSSSFTTLSCTLEKAASGKFTLVYYPHDHDIINSNNTYTSSSSSNLDLDFDNDDHIKAATPAGKSQIRKSLIKGGSISWSSSSLCNHQVGWELHLLKMKSADYMGWYRHQDLTLLDGNVVRLWKD